MRREVAYEWEAQRVSDDGHADLMELDHDTDLKGLLRRNPGWIICLIRETGNEDEGVVDRSYAYPDDAGLPEEFDSGHKVPGRYRRAWAKVAEGSR